MSSDLSNLISQIEKLKGNPELEGTLNELLKKLSVQSSSTAPVETERDNWNRSGDSRANNYQNQESDRGFSNPRVNNYQNQESGRDFSNPRANNYQNQESGRDFSNPRTNNYQKQEDSWNKPESNFNQSQYDGWNKPESNSSQKQHDGWSKPESNSSQKQHDGWSKPETTSTQSRYEDWTKSETNSTQNKYEGWTKSESTSIQNQSNKWGNPESGISRNQYDGWNKPEENTFQKQYDSWNKPETNSNQNQPDSWNKPERSSAQNQSDNWSVVERKSSENNQNNLWENPSSGYSKGTDRNFSKKEVTPTHQEADWDFLGGRSSSTSKETTNGFSGVQHSPPKNESTWDFGGRQDTSVRKEIGWSAPETSSKAPENPSWENSLTNDNATEAKKDQWDNFLDNTTFENSFESRFANAPPPSSENYGTSGYTESKEKRQSYFKRSAEGEENASSASFPYDIVEVKLADQQADVNSPLYSVHSFDDLGLKKEILNGVYGMNYNKPSKIQERALPLLLSDPPRNLIGQSQSGTGKTAAFVISMLSRIDYSIDGVQAICLTPTRELARQIMIVAKQMAKFTEATFEFAIRDEGPGRLINSHIIIGTPGTVIRYIQTRRLDPKNVKMFILDEADTMLDMQDMGEQVGAVKKFMPPDCQKVLFSATFPQIVREFAQFFAPGADEISLKQQELSIDAIKQFYMDCNSNEDRDYMLIDLYGLMTIGQSIIFVNTRAAADRIARYMTEEGHRVIALHGLQDLRERDQMIDDFRSGKAKVMVTTNVVARGIDISQVNLVINYDMPFDIDGRPDAETYLHRIGRTGRFGRSGVAINFVSNRYAYNAMLAMEEHFGHPIAKLEMTDYEATERILKKALK